MPVRNASLPNDMKSIVRLCKYIDMSIYPESFDIQNPDDKWFVYEDSRKIIGSVAARISTGEIRHIAVLPTHRRKGVGRQLMSHAIAFLRGIGRSSVWAQVRVENKESQKLFESLGFRRRSRNITSRKNPKVKLFKYILSL